MSNHGLLDFKDFDDLLNHYSRTNIICLCETALDSGVSNLTIHEAYLKTIRIINFFNKRLV